MIIYKCANCGLFLASFKDKNNYKIKAKKGITMETIKKSETETDKILILKCRCGHETKININFLD